MKQQELEKAKEYKYGFTTDIEIPCLIEISDNLMGFFMSCLANSAIAITAYLPLFVSFI